MEVDGEGGVKPDKLRELESKPEEEEALGRPPCAEMALMLTISSI